MPLEVASIQCKSLPNKKDVELFAEVTDESILVLGVELTTVTMLCLMHVWKPLCLKVEGALWTHASSITVQYPDGALSELSLLPHPRDDLIQPLGIGPSH